MNKAEAFFPAAEACALHQQLVNGNNAHVVDSLASMTPQQAAATAFYLAQLLGPRHPACLQLVDALDRMLADA